jgi:hypothetical protein
MRNVSAHTGRLSFPDARRLEQNGSRLISAKMAERLLVEPARADDSLRSLGKFWTGTIVAYPKANQSFGYELEVPNRPLIFLLDTSDFKGEKRLALVFDEFELLEEGNTGIYCPREITPITAFPQESGWYALHETGVPIMDSKSERFLWRLDSGRVGPVARAFGKDSKDVFIHHRPSEKMPVLLTQGQPDGQNAKVIELQAARK